MYDLQPHRLISVFVFYLYVWWIRVYSESVLINAHERAQNVFSIKHHKLSEQPISTILNRKNYEQKCDSLTFFFSVLFRSKWCRYHWNVVILLFNFGFISWILLYLTAKAKFSKQFSIRRVASNIHGILSASFQVKSGCQMMKWFS